MDRQNSLSSVVSQSKMDNAQIPPWEIPTLPQVPFLAGSSASLTSCEKEALPNLWATRSSNGSSLRPRLNTDTPSGSSSFSPVSPGSERKNPWNAPPSRVLQMPPTPPSPTTSRMHQQQYTVPAYERTFTPPPEACSGRQVVAIPGTMSARPGRREYASRNRARSSSNNRHGLREANQSDRVPSGRRVRSAFKDMFKRDEGQGFEVERIEDRHWTDE